MPYLAPVRGIYMSYLALGTLSSGSAGGQAALGLGWARTNVQVGMALSNYMCIQSLLFQVLREEEYLLFMGMLCHSSQILRNCSKWCLTTGYTLTYPMTAYKIVLQ